MSDCSRGRDLFTFPHHPHLLPLIIGVLFLGAKWLGLEGDDSSHPVAWVRMSAATPPSFLVLLAE